MPLWIMRARIQGQQPLSLGLEQRQKEDFEAKPCFYSGAEQTEKPTLSTSRSGARRRQKRTQGHKLRQHGLKSLPLRKAQRTSLAFLFRNI
jgi:hypothetical protein